MLIDFVFEINEVPFWVKRGPSESLYLFLRLFSSGIKPEEKNEILMVLRKT